MKHLPQVEFSSRFLVPPHSPGGGGLALYWKSHITLSISSSCDKFIEASITYKGKTFLTSFVYGEPNHTKRKAIWEEITSKHLGRDVPWFLTGDFNDILDRCEKTGGPQRAEGTFGEFRAFISQNELYDLPHSGNYLSWRGVRETHLVHCRLDRALSNGLWAENYPSSRSYYLEFEGSDHRPILSILEPHLKKKKGIFRYDRSMKDNQEITEIVTTAWNLSETAPVMQRITNCRKAISKWNLEHHINSQEVIKREKANLELAMASSIPNHLRLVEINQNLKAAYQKEEMYWRQRSRTLWLSLGDKNSGYFHAITRGRTAINKLAIIEDSNGVVVYEEDKIIKVISSYFQDLFISRSPQCVETVEKALEPCITQEMNEALTAQPTSIEIKAAMFSINPDKAPGPDGFSAGFFQTNWLVMGPKIIEEVHEIFEQGSFPNSINSTYIRLIPKILSPKSVAEYRPIALCNVYYKVISKILTRRLQPLLPSIISENQTAFVPQRAILDNVLITHENLHYLKNSGATIHCSMAVKTDMTKAYDRLEWSFIVAVMERMGFHAKWINWIFQCISTVSYAFLVNGAAQGRVIPQRGIRQGDPLSPFIFILCGEVLSGLCKKAQSDGSLPGISVSRQSPKINHLLFADDTMFFTRTNQRSCETLHTILKEYEDASGQQVSLPKSSITFSKKTQPEIRARVKQTLGIEKEGGQGKYLGLPESFGRKKKDLFTLIVDRIRQRSIKYSSRFLSNAGKMTMIKSVLSAIPTYAMSCFKLPAGLCKRIQSAFTRFWWDTTLGTKKMCWLSWSKLTRAKKHGGLGFREVQCFNDALLAKLSWRLLTNPSCLLSRVLIGKYCKYQDFLNVPINSSTSHGWRGILIGRDLLKSQLGRAIDDGRTTSIWNDPWLSLKKPTKPIGPPNLPDKNLKVSDLITEQTGDWNREKIAKILPAHGIEIQALRPSRKGASDSFIWLPTRSGEYSVKTGYHVALEQTTDPHLNQNPHQVNWNLDIWQAKTSPKLKVFLWKVVQEALPSGENLLNRGILENACCTHCGDLETTEHLFFHCKYAKEVWSLAPLSTTINPNLFQTFALTLKDSKAWLALPPTRAGAGPLFPWIVWAIWKARNQLIFEDRTFSPRETMTKATVEAREWQQAQLTPQKTPTGFKPPTGTGTPPNTVSCFTDGAWCDKSGIGGLGWIFTNDAGDTTLKGKEAERFVTSSLMAEALSIRSALLHALETGFTKIHLKSDALGLIRAISSQEQIIEIYGILFDIHALATMFDSIHFSYIPRSQNSLAYSIAKDAKIRFVNLISQRDPQVVTVGNV
ncbi:unnamed protein product [Microthlaspi erraticum]|uniref:Reverse transcriptase domain-containing protein n=1 Tax=Microthlaspi erraticum TaxID=1685480 RepID=A0A6D2JK79_9BRAS|nr:unnamed protein product [Microthlaspi erraticum]